MTVGMRWGVRDGNVGEDRSDDLFEEESARECLCACVCVFVCAVSAQERGREREMKRWERGKRGLALNRRYRRGKL